MISLDEIIWQDHRLPHPWPEIQDLCTPCLLPLGVGNCPNETDGHMGEGRGVVLTPGWMKLSWMSSAVHEEMVGFFLFDAFMCNSSRWWIFLQLTWYHYAWKSVLFPNRQLSCFWRVSGNCFRVDKLPCPLATTINLSWGERGGQTDWQVDTVWSCRSPKVCNWRSIKIETDLATNTMMEVCMDTTMDDIIFLIKLMVTEGSLWQLMWACSPTPTTFRDSKYIACSCLSPWGTPSPIEC